ncbi:MAG: acylphosphatase [Candidatus Tectomicrobia bacterium]|uniref:Acylphosphatase n=1 Tax=Tectimicrobiota bacterium TaxID=2528274 RepID=A0A932GM28_UNCTE|nr:acylphosphatase [Candidatus Tectomicrobia bacterium]
MAKKRVHLWVSGLVQGVGFRFVAERQALRLDLRGWVRNLRNGRVELMAEGEESNLRELVRWCHQGPSGARVTDVEVEWEPCQDEFNGFEIRF